MPLTTRALRLPVHLVLLAVLATLLPLVLSARADAAPPQPTTPSFGRSIEGYAPYEGQEFCSPVNRPGAERLARLIRATYGADEAIGIARNSCYSTSEHNEGRAIDWMVDATSKAGLNKANAFLGWLLATDARGNKHAMARRLGVMYIIFNKRIWRSYDPGWDTYSGTNPHTDHIHISLSYDGSTGRTSFWKGKPLAQPCAVEPLTTIAPRPTNDPMRYVPVVPTRLASTESGVGTLNGPCRLVQSSGNRLDVRVAGVGPVPDKGVAAAALNVTMRRPSWTSSLSGGPTGGEAAKLPLVSAEQNATSTASVVLPVGADGKVTLRTSFGATDVEVSVVGYYVDPAASLALQRRITTDGGDQFDVVKPKRLTSVSLPSGGRTKIAIAGGAGTDPDSTAATVSLTVKDGAGRGSLYAYPAGQDRPKAPVLTYGRSSTTVQTSVPLGRGGALVLENVGKATRTVAVDLSGAYEPAARKGGGSLSLRRSPRTVVSTKDDLQLSRLRVGTEQDFTVADVVPNEAESVLLLVTARRASTSGTLRFWAADSSRPATTDLTVAAGSEVTGTVVSGLGDGQRVRVLNDGAKGVEVRITVLGSFL